MYDELIVSFFRAFKHLEISPLHRVNLIAGGNNVGKTSVLETIWFASQDNPLNPIASSLFRRSATTNTKQNSQEFQDDRDNYWKWLFYQKDMSRCATISLLASSTDESPRTLLFSSSEQGHLTATNKDNKTIANWPPLPFAPMASNSNAMPRLACTTLSSALPSPVEDAEQVNMVSVLERDEELTAYLRLIDSRITKLKYLKLPKHQHPYVYVGLETSKELIPATQLGQGFNRMLGLFSSLMIEGTRILLIDEFENGLQHDALVPVWSALGKFAREHDVQIFATTHSYECIAAAHEAFTEHPDDFAVIKLRPDPSLGIAAFVLDHAHVDVALKTEMEIR